MSDIGTRLVQIVDDMGFGFCLTYIEHDDQVESMTGLEMKDGRKSWRLSQVELAKRLSVNPRTVARWETKERVPEIIRMALLELNNELRGNHIADRS